MSDVHEVLSSETNRVYKRVRQDYRKPVGSDGWEFEVYVMSDTASSDAMLGSGVDLVHRANFEAMVELFDSHGWPWFVTAQAFSIPVDSPEEALLEFSSAVGALENYPVIDEEAYLSMEHELVLEFIEDETNRLAHEFDVEYEDVYGVVKYEVFDHYEFDGANVYVEGGLLEEAVEEYLEIHSNVSNDGF